MSDKAIRELSLFLMGGLLAHEMSDLSWYICAGIGALVIVLAPKHPASSREGSKS